MGVFHDLFETETDDSRSPDLHRPSPGRGPRHRDRQKLHDLRLQKGRRDNRRASYCNVFQIESEKVGSIPTLSPAPFCHVRIRPSSIAPPSRGIGRQTVRPPPPCHSSPWCIANGMSASINFAGSSPSHDFCTPLLLWIPNIKTWGFASRWPRLLSRYGSDWPPTSKIFHRSTALYFLKKK